MVLCCLVLCCAVLCCPHARSTGACHTPALASRPRPTASQHPRTDRQAGARWCALIGPRPRLIALCLAESDEAARTTASHVRFVSLLFFFSSSSSSSFDPALSLSLPLYTHGSALLPASSLLLNLLLLLSLGLGVPVFSCLPNPQPWPRRPTLLPFPAARTSTPPLPATRSTHPLRRLLPLPALPATTPILATTTSPRPTAASRIAAMAAGRAAPRRQAPAPSRQALCGAGRA